MLGELVEGTLPKEVEPGLCLEPWRGNTNDDVCSTGVLQNVGLFLRFQNLTYFCYNFYQFLNQVKLMSYRVMTH